MSAWILSIVGIITLGVLVDIILPDGETNKYIKGIFSMIVIFMIIAPLPKMMNSDFDFGNFVDIQTVKEDENAVQAFNKKRMDIEQVKLLQFLEENNYFCVKAVIIFQSNNIYMLDKLELDITNCENALANKVIFKEKVQQKYPNSEVILIDKSIN
ncbi:MAG: stage III sporulation protein AF [Clostridia bacterium]